MGAAARGSRSTANRDLAIYNPLRKPSALEALGPEVNSAQTRPLQLLC